MTTKKKCFPNSTLLFRQNIYFNAYIYVSTNRYTYIDIDITTMHIYDTKLCRAVDGKEKEIFFFLQDLYVYIYVYVRPYT